MARDLSGLGNEAVSALDKIAELHSPVADGYDLCHHCAQPWPCPSRRLCDEGGPTQAERDAFEEMREAIAERDEARADAQRLADAARDLGGEMQAALDEVRRKHVAGCVCWGCEGKPDALTRGLVTTIAALSAHDDALVDGEGK